MSSQHSIVTEVAGGHVGWVAGVLSAVASVAIPDEVLPFALKATAALACGFLTYVGHWLGKRLTGWAFPPKS